MGGCAYVLDDTSCFYIGLIPLCPPHGVWSEHAGSSMMLRGDPRASMEQVIVEVPFSDIVLYERESGLIILLTVGSLKKQHSTAWTFLP